MSERIQSLINDLASGDMSALGELYDILSGRVFNYALTITKNREMAEDATQDVFLQINAQAARLARISGQTAYIMVMTRHHAYNLLERASRAEPLPDEAPELTVAPPRYDRLLFEEAFARLPASQRETVWLHLICGFTHKEVAKMHDAPLVTVKWRYGRAIKRLREYFIQSGYQPAKKEENSYGSP
ncbi:MAG: sigma-70 family RNA polymerase sigma factor [Clostridiales bacterium]|nr:sigma-70 family RNA polymerase sigma factor [Clostridiales bacterium]